MNIDQALQDYANAEQRKAAALEELNQRFAEALELLEHTLDILTGNGGEK